MVPKPFFFWTNGFQDHLSKGPIDPRVAFKNELFTWWRIPKALHTPGMGRIFTQHKFPKVTYLVQHVIPLLCYLQKSDSAIPGL